MQRFLTGRPEAVLPLSVANKQTNVAVLPLSVATNVAVLLLSVAKNVAVLLLSVEPQMWQCCYCPVVSISGRLPESWT